MNWGYLVVMSGFIMYTLFYGVLYNYNLLNIEFKHHFNASATGTALPGSIAIMSSGVSASVVTYIYQVIGHRKTICIGVALSSLGLLATSFVHDIQVVCITYGVMFGLGCAFMHLPFVSVTSCYFKGRYLTRVLCFQFVGASVGLSLAPGIEWLYSRYSWRVALRIIAIVLTVIGLPCTAVATGNRSQEENINEDSKDTKKVVKKSRKQTSSLFRYMTLMKTFNYVISMPAFLLMSVSVAFSYISLGIYLENASLNTATISLILSLMGAGDIVGRLSISFGSMHVPLSLTVQYILVIITTAGFTVAIPFSTTQTSLIVVLTGLGMTRGMLFTAVVSAAIDVAPTALSAEGLAMMYIFFGTGTFLAPYVTDNIYDKTGSYKLGIFVCVGTYILAAALFTIGHIYKRYTNRSNMHSELMETKFESVPMDEATEQPV
ncbi:monocarboxylate transporter 13-like [Antedon mediterranea]|uniref:monocarboxylate transporter 13-like n=1 Tax=Antedon mediterranea TaxID=105859 RepID=UPI003AF6582C